MNVSGSKYIAEQKPLKELSEEEKPPHQDERQIALDTDRSFVLYPVGGYNLILEGFLNKVIERARMLIKITKRPEI